MFFRCQNGYSHENNTFFVTRYLVALVQFSDMSRYEFFSLLKESFVDSFVSWLRESVETWDMDGID